MANRNKFKVNSAIFKLMFYFILALLTSAPSCTSVLQPGSRYVNNATTNLTRNLASHTDDIARIGKIYGDDIAKLIRESSPGDIKKLNHQVFLINNKLATAAINYQDNISILPNRAIIINKPRNFLRLANQDLVIESLDRIALINKIDDIGIQETHLEDLVGENVILTFPNSTLEKLNDARKNALEQASYRAAQDAVKKALAENISSDSLDALVKEAAKKAAFQELSKQTKPSIKPGTIVLVSIVEFNPIVNASVNRALQERTTKHRKSQ